MTIDPQDDIQINPVGVTPGTSSTVQNNTTVSTSGTSSDAVVNPVSMSPFSLNLGSDNPFVAAPNPTPAPSPVPTVPVVDNSLQIQSAPTQPKPINQRAFNLDADTESTSSGPAKPEKFAIPKMVQEKYPDLVELIKTTESMDDDERDYWFQIMPVMTEEQIEKFKSILVTEKQQLTDLDKEYEEELNHLNEKHLLEWKEFETKEKSNAIKQAEAVDQAQQKQIEEDLLAKLADV